MEAATSAKQKPELELLKAVYKGQLLREGSTGVATLEQVMNEMHDRVSDGDQVELDLKRAVDRGLVALEQSSKTVKLTAQGRAALKVVMIGGAFEIIHPGHLHTISQAKRLGNMLVAVIATDRTVSKNKGRDPVTTQEWRVRLVSSIRDVDVALAGGQGSIYDTLERVRPDVVALGYDQTHNPADIESEARKRGLSLSVVRMNSSPLPDVKTSKIIGTL